MSCKGLDMASGALDSNEAEAEIKKNDDSPGHRRWRYWWTTQNLIVKRSCGWSILVISIT